jgi:hypothetical protein
LATCPDCGEYLNDGHRCHARFRYVVREIIDVILALLVGGTAGGLTVGEFGGRIMGPPFVVLGAAIGFMLVLVVLRSFHAR